MFGNCHRKCPENSLKMPGCPEMSGKSQYSGHCECPENVRKMSRRLAGTKHRLAKKDLVRFNKLIGDYSSLDLSKNWLPIVTI
jgi:coenzyme F420-reducing hydrogenase gamma subunit